MRIFIKLSDILYCHPPFADIILQVFWPPQEISIYLALSKIFG